MRAIFTLSAVLLAVPGWSEECKPTYQVSYEMCANPANGTEARFEETDWILVNKGARKVSADLCTEHIPTLQSQRPTAKNIRFFKIDDRDATFRGLGKRDVYCKYQLEDVGYKVAASEACPIASVASDCFSGINKDFVVQCAAQTPQNVTDKWKKAGCLVDSIKNAAQIQGLDQPTYDSAKFQLRLLIESASPEDARLRQWILSQPVRLN